MPRKNLGGDTHEIPGGTNSNDMIRVSLPEKDGAIERAFEKLDDELNAWAASMREAHSVLTRLAHKTVPVPTEYETEPPSSTQEDDTVVDTAQTQATATLDETIETCPIEPIAHNETKVARSTNDDDSTRSFNGDTVCETIDSQEESVPLAERESTAESASATHLPPSTEESSTPTEFSAPTSAEDDKALLASLDGETLERVRVLRRLYPQTKSIRELLDECSLSEPTSVTDPPKKRSWWKR